jgi:hypothetical protein
MTTPHPDPIRSTGHGFTTYTDQLPTPRIHQDPWMLLRAIAELLEPCEPPEISAGWDRCAHAERWPCPVTRAWRIARTAYDRPDDVPSGQPAVAPAIDLTSGPATSDGDVPAPAVDRHRPPQR